MYEFTRVSKFNKYLLNALSTTGNTLGVRDLKISKTLSSPSDRSWSPFIFLRKLLMQWFSTGCDLFPPGGIGQSGDIFCCHRMKMGVDVEQVLSS